ncbi:MAG: TIGR04086 family membrane protein [Ruminococcaceae bacterium]|nr:TIGR04086 family membrane protein [Oscillospiraceae bacterium]
MTATTKNKTHYPLRQYLRPTLLGLLSAFAATFLLIAFFSLFFVIIESIAKSAVVPLSLLSAAAGCFIGAYICTSMTRCYGVLLGLLIASAIFAIMWIISALTSDCLFGAENAIKLVLLAIAGCAGGLTGCSHKPRRRR